MVQTFSENLITSDNAEFFRAFQCMNGNGKSRSTRAISENAVVYGQEMKVPFRCVDVVFIYYLFMCFFPLKLCRTVCAVSLSHFKIRFKL